MDQKLSIPTPEKHRGFRSARALAVVALLAAGFGLQAHFFRTFPQPILFGDPAGYHATGQRFLAAFDQIAGGGSWSAAFDGVRGYFYIFGVSAVFALLETIRPGDFAFFRLFFAGCNTLAMLGVFLLARGLTRSFACGLTALVLAAIYPSFALQTGRLYPDPLTCCLFVWSAWAYIEGVQRSSRRWMALAGLLFVAALIVRLQIALYMLIVLPFAFAMTARWWLRSRRSRRLALTLALALLPIWFIWLGVSRAVGERDDVTRLGNFSFRPSYILGFWQNLETDGWVGPYRLKTEPFYKALEERGRSEPEVLRSRWRQARFAAQYASRRPALSTLIVLHNAYRLYDRPANDYKWDYPFSYRLQVWYQRLICVLALSGIALYASRRGATLGIFLMPLSLLPLHGLLFSWPRYNMPAMPILIAAAGAYAGELLFRRESRRVLRDRRALIATGIGAALLAAGAAAFSRMPEIAHALSVAGLVAMLAVPFIVSGLLSKTRRRAGFALAAYLMLVILFFSHVMRDRLWHETTLTIGRNAPGVEQEIRLTSDAIATLQRTRQSFIVFDLAVPRGDTSGMILTVQGRDIPVERLVPTMPPLGESTFTGGRDWRGYRQWWAIPVEPWMIPSSEHAPLRVTLKADSNAALALTADRFGGQNERYEGPSFGDWPHWVALKMEYDADSRLPIRRRLESKATTSYAIEPSGAKRRLRSVVRIRLIATAGNEGETAWESAPAPRGSAAWGFCAYSAGRTSAELTVDERSVFTFPLASRDDFDVQNAAYVLCHRSLPEKGYKTYGGYVLKGPASGAASRFHLRFLTGMSHKPAFFVVDRKWDPSVLDEVYRRCGVPENAARVDGVARVTSADRNNYPDDTGWWRVTSVY
ncbi:MAG: glycosyltransferase family 39 protein [Vicinamibacteria bacterium]|nr:glycosyltransferase family 39 protein [Vicinamibacteria bacterium]